MRIVLSKPWLLGATLIVVLLVAIWFRVTGLASAPFWLDEAYSAYAAEKGLTFILTVLPGYETHPPVYSALLSGWIKLAGTSLGGFRSLGLVAGLLLFPLSWAVACRAADAIGADRRVAGIAVLALLAVAPAIIYITRLVRPYALMALAYLFGLWAILALTRYHSDHGRLHPGYGCAYLASLVLTVWLHNLGTLYAGSLGLALLILMGPMVLIRRHGRAFFLGHGAAALLVLPAYIILLDQAPTWQSSTWLRFSWSAVGPNLLTIYGLANLIAVLLALFITAAAIGQRRKAARLWLALLTLCLLPTLLSLLISVTIAPVFLARTLAPLSLILILMIGLGVSLPWRLPRAAYLILLVTTAAYSLSASQLPPTENWRGAANWIKARIAPGDVIYAYPNEGALPFGYAMRDLDLAYPVRPIPSPVPASDPEGWYPTGSRGVVSLPRHRLDAIASDARSRNVPTIWLLRLGASTYDKGDGFLAALRRDRRVVARWTDGPIDVVGLARSGEPVSAERPPTKQPQP